MNMQIIEEWLGDGMEVNAVNPCVFDTQDLEVEERLLTAAKLKSFYPSFALSATELIHKLFVKYTVPNTLIITTPNEHENVQRIIKHLNTDVVYVDPNDTQFDMGIIDRASQYSNVILYMIGTQYSTGIVNNYGLYRWIKYQIEKYGIPCILICDACQELFLLDRDYTDFDYVIYTGHSLVQLFNLGMLFSKEPIDIGNHWAHNVDYYIDCLSFVLDRKKHLLQFNQVMNKAFATEIDNHKVVVFNNSAPHLFCFKLNNLSMVQNYRAWIDLFRKHHLVLQKIDQDWIIRFRAQDVMREHTLFIDSLKFLQGVLNEDL